MDEEEVKRLEELIKEDNVEELSNIFNLNENLRTNFNNFTAYYDLLPLLLLSVDENSQKVVEYLLSQDFVDKSICNGEGDNIYHVVCRMRGAEELFSIIERKVPHNLILNHSHFRVNAFYNACEFNNVFIVKRVYEILKSLQLDLTHIKSDAMKYAVRNKDIEVIKYILSTFEINDDIYEILFYAIGYSKIDIVVYIVNFYICQSIPSHLHNQFHIFHFSNHPPSNYIINNKILIPNNTNNQNSKEENNFNEEIKEKFNSKKIQKRERDDCDDVFVNQNKKIKLSNHNNDNNEDDYNDNGYYLKLVEDNFHKIMNIKLNGNRIWHIVCCNVNVDVVQLIYSLKGIQPDLLNDNGYNAFLIACEQNSNIKVIKYLHKLFPSFIHSQITQNGGIQNAAYLLKNNFSIYRIDKLKTLHYLYLNGIDIHLLSKKFHRNTIINQSIYSKTGDYLGIDDDIDKYLKVISQDFDYLQNEHDDKAYRKPSFWKQFHHHNNNKLADEESKRINEWKNRYEEHVLRHLSKMIQEHMLQPHQNLYRFS